MSNISTLAALESHLSSRTQVTARPMVDLKARRSPSLMEAYFAEVQYSSFANHGSSHQLRTSLKPLKNSNR